MSYGLGAIAAALAVVVGGIGYKAYRDRLTGNNDSNSDIAEEHLNILGGYGEIRGYRLTTGDSVFRDDNYFYASAVKWAIDGSSGLQLSDSKGLLTDGKQLYTQHDGNVYITDSYGEETLALALGDMLTEANQIRLLKNGDYLITGTSVVAAEDVPKDAAPMPHTEGGFAQMKTVVYHTNPTDDEKCFVILSGFYPVGSTPNALLNSMMVSIDSEERGWYVYNPEANSIYYEAFGADQPGDENRVFPGFNATVSSGTGTVTGFTVQDDVLYYERLVKAANADGGMRTIAEFHTERCGEEEQDSSWRGDYDIAGMNPENEYPCYSYFGEQYLYGVMQKMTDTGLHLRVLRNAYPMDDGENIVFDVPLAELYGDDVPDRMERPEICFFDTGDYLFFNLPKEGRNGEQAVQVNLQTGTWFYLGTDYNVTQTPEQSSETIREDSYEGIYGEELASGYCSPEQFPQYYIPPENVEKDTDKIECYRMLPFAKASESALDTEALGQHLPDGGTWSRRDPDASRMTYEQAFDCITTGALSGWEIMVTLCKLSAGYDAEAYLENQALSDREFWLDDAGKEFFYVLMYRPSDGMGAIDRAEFYFFRYDEAAKQYHYARLPDGSSERLSGKQPAGTNFLGGTGTVHPYGLSKCSIGMAEDDAWYYDLQSGRRAPKQDDPDTAFEPMPEDVVQRFYPNGGSLLTDGENFYEHETGRVELYRLDNDGTKHGMPLPLDGMDGLDSGRISYQKLYLMDDDKLFVLMTGYMKGTDEMRVIPYLTDIKTEETELLTNQGTTPEEQLNIWECGKYTKDCIYTVSGNGSMLHMNRLDSEFFTSIGLDPDVHPTGDKWFVGEDGKLWFIWQNGWYQMELDDRKESFMQPQPAFAKIPNFEVWEPVPGTMQILTYLSSYEQGTKTGLKLSRYNGSDAYEMLQSSPCQILGAYSDNGVIHIAAKVGYAADAPDPDSPPQIVFITKDGSSVSSVGISEE